MRYNSKTLEMELTLDQALQKAVEAHKAGKVHKAGRYYTTIIRAQPKHPDANHNMGVLAVGVGKVEQALPFFKTALEANPNIAQFWLSYIDALIKLDRMADAKAVFDQAKSIGANGDAFDQIELQLNTSSFDVKNEIQEDIQTAPNILDELKLDKALKFANKQVKDGLSGEAKKIYQDILKKFPKNKQAWHGIKTLASRTSANTADIGEPPGDQLQGLVNMYTQGQYQKVLNQTSQLLEEFPNSISLYNITGAANKSLGRLEEAITAYKKALILKPDFAEAYNNMGNALQKQGKLEEAIQAFDKVLAIKPDLAEAYNNLGVALQEQGKLDEALESYKKAISLKPGFTEVYNNIGHTLKDQGKLDEAIEAYNKALAIKPDYAEAYNNMGNALQEQGKLEEAIEAYNKALSLKPDYVEAFNNMGLVFQKQGKLDEAIKTYNKALSSKPDYAQAYNNLGNALKEQGQLEEAIEAYQKASALKPDFYHSYSSYLHQAAIMCDWQNFETSLLTNYLAKSTSDKIKYPMAVFPFLHLYPQPDIQLRLSKLFSTNAFKKDRLLPIIKRPKLRPEKLRIGYFSPDFKDHPVAQMIESVLRHHDRSKFEIFAYSFGKSLDGLMHQKIVNASDTFRDVQSKSAQNIALLAREDNIDIAIDLAGYTKNSKSEIFYQRTAPIQINYLGYPGTMGTDFMDYIIADKTLIPWEMESHYSEKIIFMPDSYQPINDELEILEDTPPRQELGLPQSAFVFCAINQAYKIKPKEFEIWMRLLSRVKDSVLWLKNQNKWMVENLQSEAHKRGIEPSRLIFAERIAHEQYLAQFKQADLYLDTFNYNAGTTASDVLMAGLPVVTKMGDTYASRMAASLLNAAGMRELITKTVKEYEDLALELALNSRKLRKIRERLQKKLKTAPILNAELYTRNLEAGYQQAYDNYYYLNSVRNIDVTPGQSSEYTEVPK